MKHFAGLMATLCLAYQTEATKELIELYWQHLSTYPEHILMGAVDRAIAELRFFPRIADLKTYCDEARAIELQADYNRRMSNPRLEAPIDDDEAKQIIRQFKNRMGW